MNIIKQTRNAAKPQNQFFNYRSKFLTKNQYSPVPLPSVLNHTSFPLDICSNLVLSKLKLLTWNIFLLFLVTVTLTTVPVPVTHSFCVNRSRLLLSINRSFFPREVSLSGTFVKHRYTVDKTEQDFKVCV